MRGCGTKSQPLRSASPPRPTLAGAGYRFSDPLYQNDAGVVAGDPNRYTGVNTNNGRDAWVWNGTSTLQVGLIGGAYTGSFGYQYSSPQFLNEAGEVVGISSRFTGINTGNGGDTWVWNGTTTTQIGLTGGLYTGMRDISSVRRGSTMPMVKWRDIQTVTRA